VVSPRSKRWPTPRSTSADPTETAPIRSDPPEAVTTPLVVAFTMLPAVRIHLKLEQVSERLASWHVGKRGHKLATSLPAPGGFGFIRCT
jgi:hypothetical protein